MACDMLPPLGRQRTGRMPTELESWLDQLGLGQYAATFAAHAIDLDVVADLTDADLVDLGVAPLGHRKRLLSAIAGVQRSRVDNFVVGLLPAPPAPRSRPKAERRQVSVLFCDLVGSTALAHRLDPEELAPIIDRYHTTASETVRQLGGHVARFLGDGMMAYFGWPTSHEDDAERAVAAGLELIETVSRHPDTGRRAPGGARRRGDRPRRDRLRHQGQRRRHFRRDPQCRRPASGGGRAQQPGRVAADGAPCRPVVPLQEPRQAHAARAGRSAGNPGGQGHPLLAQSLHGIARPLDGAAGRPQRGGRAAAQPLAADGRLRGTGRPAVRRRRDRQIAPRAIDQGSHRRRDRRAALSMLAPAPGHGAVSGRPATHAIDSVWWANKASRTSSPRRGSGCRRAASTSTSICRWSATCCRSTRRITGCRTPRRNRSATGW